MIQVRVKTDEGEEFPTALGVAGLLLNGLGLTAAVLGVQWGGHAPASEILGLAWLYVNLCVAAGWFLLWPLLGATPKTGRTLGGELAGLILAALPAVGVAAWLSEVNLPMVIQMLLLQAGLALVAAGVMAWRSGAIGNAVLAGLLAGLFVVLPAIAYVQAEFFSATPWADGWQSVVPALAIYRLANGSGEWWVGVLFVLLGAGLLLGRKGT